VHAAHVVDAVHVEQPLVQTAIKHRLACSATFKRARTATSGITYPCRQPPRGLSLIDMSQCSFGRGGYKK
jgi:hypothetical protein